MSDSLGAAPALLSSGQPIAPAPEEAYQPMPTSTSIPISPPPLQYQALQPQQPQAATSVTLQASRSQSAPNLYPVVDPLTIRSPPSGNQLPRSASNPYLYNNGYPYPPPPGYPTYPAYNNPQMQYGHPLYPGYYVQPQMLHRNKTTIITMSGDGRQPAKVVSYYSPTYMSSQPVITNRPVQVVYQQPQAKVVQTQSQQQVQQVQQKIPASTPNKKDKKKKKGKDYVNLKEDTSDQKSKSQYSVPQYPAPNSVNGTTTSTPSAPLSTMTPTSTKPMYYVQAPPLPAGWEIRLDASGKPYYVDHLHKTTTYTHPLLAARNQQLQSTTSNTKTARGSLPELPSGWEVKQDSEGRDYYIDHNSKTTSYNPPPIPLDPQPSEVSPSDIKVAM